MGRTPIEKWSRGELEDNYHGIAEQMTTLKKTKGRLENELKILNGRINRLAGSKGVPNQEDSRKTKELENINKLLNQKLQVLKHQLLSYTQVNKRPTSTHRLRPLSKTSTSRPNTQNNEQRISSEPTERRIEEPKSARKQEPYIKQEPQSISHSFPSSRTSLIWKNEALPRQNTSKHESTYDIHNGRQSQNRTYINDNFDRQVTSDSESARDAVRLRYQNRELEVEVEELRITHGKTETKLAMLRNEYDKVVDELEVYRKKARVAEQSWSSLKEDLQRSTEAHEKLIEIMNTELGILKKENTSLKEAHSRMINNSVNHDGSKIEFEEINHLRTRLSEARELLALSESVKNKAEKELQKLSDENSRLKNQNEELAADIGLKIGSNPIVPQNTTTSTSNNVSATNHFSSVLDRLSGDIFNIVDTHIKRDAAVDDGPTPYRLDQNTAERWQKMYEQIYLELEKVRNLLLAEHSLNQKMREETRNVKELMDFSKKSYEAKIAELNAELNKQEKQVELSENKLQSIAHGGAIFGMDGARSDSSAMITLRFSKITVSEEALKLMESARPLLFVAVEFFDFELMTTPQLQGPETEFSYSIAYDISVSDLLIHYLEMEGIALELYETQNGSYKQWASAKISLKKLLYARGSTLLKGQLRFCSTNKGTEKCVLATLDYAIEAPSNLNKALNAQKRKVLANALLPTSLEVNIHNELIIEILEISLPDSPDLLHKSLYAAYQIYDLPVHMTRTMLTDKTGTLEVGDKRAWTLPDGTIALHNYFKNEELVIYVIEESEQKDGEISGQNIKKPMDSALRSVTLPLFPLVRGQRIQGTFPLDNNKKTGIDISTSIASIKISIYWKFPYKFADFDNLPSLSSAKSSTKNFDIKTVHESTQDEVATRNDAAPISTISKDPDDVEKSSNSGNTKQDRIAKDSSRSASSSSEDHDEAEKRLRTILEMHLSTENRAEAGLVSDVTGNNQQILDVIKSDEVIQEDHFATPNNNISYASTSSSSSSERQQNETPILPPPSVGSSSISSNGLELPSGPESPESSSSGTDSRSEAKNEGHSRDKLPPLRNEAKMIEAIVEHDNHPPLDQSKEPNGLVTVPKPPVRRSLLGTLPPLVDPSKDQQPLRRQNKAVEFKDPLHSSIPPSESSSIIGEEMWSEGISGSENDDGTIDQQIDEKHENSSQDKPSAFQQTSATTVQHSSLRNRENGRSDEATPANEYFSQLELSTTSILQIKIGRLRLLEHSILLEPKYDGARVFVEWALLDLNREICETPGTIILPRSKNAYQGFDYERAYELTKRQRALLKQWMYLGIRATFTLVLDPGENEAGDFDDLCVGELNLSDALKTETHNITMRNVDNISLAVLEVTFYYSVNLKMFLENK